MKDYQTIRQDLVRYVWDAVPSTKIEYNPSHGDCSGMVDRIADIILTANEGLVEVIVSRISNAPTSKKAQRVSTWKKQLRRAASAYMDALYHELDLAGAFINHPTGNLSCGVVISNSDCMIKAVKKARGIARLRPRLYGFVYFWRDAA